MIVIETLLVDNLYIIRSLTYLLMLLKKSILKNKESYKYYNLNSVTFGLGYSLNG